MDKEKLKNGRIKRAVKRLMQLKIMKRNILHILMQLIIMKKNILYILMQLKTMIRDILYISLSVKKMSVLLQLDSSQPLPELIQ